MLEWLRRNGAALVGGVVLGLAVIVGWQWWQRHQQVQLLEAAQRYQQAIEAVATNDAEASGQVQALGPGAFATLASLELARSQVASGEADSAIKTLQAIETLDPAMQGVVELRLARLLIDSGKPEEALKRVADNITPAGLEVRGDAEYALGRMEQAREAYTQAIGKVDVASPERRILELKLVEVGGTPATTEAQS
ncbi:MAG: tetratricopeptide repeat protein [Pseudomonadota bacterium]|nr:tetratricopeptide repeat protein [Pseudomonadota bacterium]